MSNMDTTARLVLMQSANLVKEELVELTNNIAMTEAKLEITAVEFSKGVF